MLHEKKVFAKRARKNIQHASRVRKKRKQKKSCDNTAEKKMEWLKQVDTLTFSGGGIRGIAHIGALEALEENWKANCNRSIYTHVRAVSGSSIGSVVAFFLANKVSLTELKNLFLGSEWNSLYQQIDLPKITSHYGLIDGQKTQRKTLERVLKHPEETFGELKARTGISLTVCVSCLDTNHFEYHSDVTTPLYSIVNSVLASCAIPLIFQPQKIHGKRYVDGALLNNIPLPCYFQLDTTLAFHLNSDLVTKKGPLLGSGNYYQMLLSPLMGYIEEIMYLTLNFIEHQQRSNLPKLFQGHIVPLECPAHIASWNFNLTQQERQRLLGYGRDSMTKFLNTHIILVGELMTSFIVNYAKMTPEKTLPSQENNPVTNTVEKKT